MAEAMRNFWSGIGSKWYEEELQNKTQQEKDELLASKVKWYGTMCVSGIGTLFWGNTLSALKKLNKTHPDSPGTYACVVFFLVCFLLMGLGASEAYLPTSTPRHAVNLTGTGAWAAVLCALGCFHLATYELHPSPQAAYVLSSMAITSATVSMYWALKAQDPQFLHILAKLIGWAVYGIWQLPGLIYTWARGIWAYCAGYRQI